VAEEKRLREEAERLAAEEAERQRLAEIARLKKVTLIFLCVYVLSMVFALFDIIVIMIFMSFVTSSIHS
jgi:hypothetical protein